MIKRDHKNIDCYSEAIYSECERYRYWLRRCWNPAAKDVAFLMLNPSTATEEQNDPTVERCERRARAMGYGAMIVVNLFAMRSTDPAGLLADHDPTGGPLCDQRILMAADFSAKMICAWGNHKAIQEREKEVVEMLCAAGMHDKLHALGTNKDGSPKHPLYVSYDVRPEPWPTVVEEPARVGWEDV